MNIEEEYLVDHVLSEKIYRIFQYIQDTIKEKGDISQFKEDVLYVIHFLLERQLEPKQLTATEILVKQREYMLYKEQRKKDEEYIRTLKCELYKKDKIINEIIKRLDNDIKRITETKSDGYTDDYRKCRLKAYRTKTKEIKEYIEKQYFTKKVEGK